MGEVYRGRDTKLDREIAIKVLPAALARDPERLARFEREAKVLASLNHPNIAQIYGVEESNGIPALVMELVPGETLKGPIQLERALNFARQIADALEAAHDKGITHRDLKPANIMITPQGVVKVLDFGLAAVAQPPGGSEGDPANSPTLTMRATQVGMILGTAGYMAPEQAAGQAVDKRADIWSFGVVLWEMLTGERMFTGETVSHVLAAVLTKEPDLTRVPLKVRPLLERCLRKDPKKRLRDIGDAWPLLESTPSSMTVDPLPETSRSSRLGAKAAWGTAAICLIALGAVSFTHFREAPPAAHALRLSIEVPENAFIASFDLSPDGRTLVLAANIPPAPGQLYLRSLDSTELRPIAGTSAARTPFWSPDGRSIGFFADAKLKVVSAGGGPVRTLCDSGLGTGTWNRDGAILFGSSITRQIMRVSASGGVCAPVLTPESVADYRAPVFLPDGQHFFYASMGAGDGSKSGVFVAELDHPNPRRILPDVSGVVYVPPESGGRLAHLLFLRETTLMAQPLDPGTLQPAGDPFAVAEQASTTNSPPQLAAAASADSTLVYLANLRLDTQLAWYDRSGKVLGKVGARGRWTAVSLSSDGRTAASSRSDRAGGPPETWLYDLARNVESRFGSAFSGSAVWSPDGAHIAFYHLSQRSTYLREVTGTTEELLVRGSPSGWSADGRFLLYTDADPKNQGDIWVLPDPLNKSGARKPVPFLRTPFDESHAQFSPDGRWVAYTSNESGRYEIYLRPFPTLVSESGVKWRVSSNGGQQPRWRRDGRELFYLEPAPPRLQLMAMPVSPGPRPIAPDAMPKALFEYRGLFYVPQLNLFTYSPSNDGQRFLVNANADQDVRPTLNVMLNWRALVTK